MQMKFNLLDENLSKRTIKEKKPTMPEIEFSKPQKELLARKIQTYFEDELEHEIGRFEAEFLLDFFTKEIGGFFYNQGLQDAQAVLQKNVENISEELYAIEKPTGYSHRPS